MASSSGQEAAAGNINPLLLVSARKGFWEVLDFLFRREDAQEPPMMIPSEEFRAVVDKVYDRIGVSATPNAELGVHDLQPVSLAAGALLKGVTLAGDTALHVVASNGDDQDFLKSARMICRRDKILLSAKNHNGDTPLHCARRAGNPKMVSYLIDLAGPEAAPRVINPRLLLSARLGCWKDLDFLFWNAQDPPKMISTDDFHRFRELAKRSITAPPARDGGEGVTPNRDTATPACDVEAGGVPDSYTATPALDGGEGVGQPSTLLTAARELLNGVTPDGDSALHAVARSGDGEDFRKYARMVCSRERDLLFAKNHNGDTPLHCAARAGNSEMVSCLIAQAMGGADRPCRKLMLLRMQNKSHETALHDAVRIEDGRLLGPKDREELFDAEGTPEETKIRVFVDQQKGMTIVKKLMHNDSQLAKYPADGISPLHLAILLEKSTIAVTLKVKSGVNLSYTGADGQNALHVAVLRDTNTVMVELLLDWNKSLTAQVDKDGNTPLHFASSIYFRTIPNLRQFLLFVWFPWRSTHALPIVFRANPAALYQADKKGFFPIHVAASVGALVIIRFFVQECPDSAGLRDATGRTFLHVAVEKRRSGIISYACGDPSLAWILNMRDTDGNTALHLAVQTGSIRMFCALFGNREVNLNITNNKGETPHDVAISKIPRGLSYAGNTENIIRRALLSVRANHGAHRWDKADKKYIPGSNPEDEEKESKKLKAASKTLILASVLIATMAFSATFTLTRGYITDHANGGMLTLAGGRYIFDAFTMATALTFICSILATAGFVFAEISMVNLITRRIYAFTAMIFMSSSVACLSIVFAMGVYMVVTPVARGTAVVICVITPVILIGVDIVFLFKLVILARPLCNRKGLFVGMLQLLCWILVKMAAKLCAFVVTFGWAALARIHWHHLLLRVKQWWYY